MLLGRDGERLGSGAIYRCWTRYQRRESGGVSIQTAGLSRCPRAHGGHSGYLQGVRHRAKLEVIKRTRGLVVNEPVSRVMKC